MFGEKTKKYIWILAIGLVFATAYPLANWLSGIRGAREVPLALEPYVPFIPWMIFIYLGVFPYIMISGIFCKKYEHIRNMACAVIALILSSTIFYIIFPTTMPRPEIDSVPGFTGWLFKILRGADRPNNVFPSLHVSAVVLISLINAHHFPKSKWLGIFAVLAVSASTLFVKQHAVVDILGGAIFGFGAYYIFFKKPEENKPTEKQVP